METNTQDWRLKSRILQHTTERNYRALAEDYEEAGDFEKALESAYTARRFWQALRIAKNHIPKKDRKSVV